MKRIFTFYELLPDILDKWLNFDHIKIIIFLFIFCSNKWKIACNKWVQEVSLKDYQETEQWKSAF